MTTETPREPTLGPAPYDAAEQGLLQQRRVAELIEKRAVGQADARLLMDVLGISPDVFRVQWARTIQLGGAGYITLSMDLDVRKISQLDRAFLQELATALTALLAFHSEEPRRV